MDRGRYTVLVGEQPVTAMRARELGRKSVVVGDRVRVVGDLGGGNDALSRIVRVEPRSSVLRRTADDSDPFERLLVANAEQLAIVTALADPPPRTGMIDRCIVAAYTGRLTPVLVLTKSDLADPAELVTTYGAAGVSSVATGARGEQGLDALRAALADRVTVLVGHSGVGKSTLVNRLVPDAGRVTGVVNDVTGRGRHTSSSAVALPLPDGGWVIDTPGVRSFGLAHVTDAELVSSFHDLAPAVADCPSGCSHLDEPACGLDAWVAQGNAAPARLQSLRRLIASRAED